MPRSRLQKSNSAGSSDSDDKTKEKGFSFASSFSSLKPIATTKPNLSSAPLYPALNSFSSSSPSPSKAKNFAISNNDKEKKENEKGLKFVALNEQFKDSIISAINKHKDVDLLKICEKYINYRKSIVGSFPSSTTPISTSTSTSTSASTSTSTSTFNFGAKESKQSTPPHSSSTFNFKPLASEHKEKLEKEKPIFSSKSLTPNLSSNSNSNTFNFSSVTKPKNPEVTKPAKLENKPVAKVDSDSDSESDDEVEVKGPQFTLDKPPTTTNSPFVFNKSTKADNSNTTTGSGPGFVFKVEDKPKNFKSPFKFKTEEVVKKDTTEGPKSFSFNANKNDTEKNNDSSKPAFSLPTGPEKSTKDDSVSNNKPNFSFNGLSSQKPAFSFTSSTATTVDDNTKPKSVFSFNSAATTSTTDDSKITDTNDDDKSSSFGAKDFTWNPSQKISFGKPATTEQKDSSNDSALATATAANTTTTKPSSVFNFGGNKSFGTSGSSSGFSFSNATKSPDSTNNVNKPFSFNSNSNSPFSSNSSKTAFSINTFKPNPTNGTPATKPEDNNNKTESITTHTDSQQKDFSTEQGPGEENEEIKYEKKAKIYNFNAEDKKSPYTVLGVGMLKVLKHKETKKTRVLVRSDGAGRVLINFSLNDKINYGPVQKGKNEMVRIPCFTKDGIDTYVIRVKTGKDGEELIKVLEAEKKGN